MGHAASFAYTKLVARLNRFPQGAPAGKYLYRILKILFSETEAYLVSLLPIKPFTVRTASRLWKLGLRETRKILDNLAGRAILLDILQKGEQMYVLPPPMAGFFEFSMMRFRKDIDQKTLAELFYQYLNVEEDFVKDLFTGGQARLGRTFVNETVVPDEDAIHVLDYERASSVIRTASHICISLCYCRHKMLHMKRACGAPLDICMTFNSVAASLTKHGIGRTVDVVEAMDLLQQAYSLNLVQFGENIRQEVHFICNCCGCCCEALLAAKRFASDNPIYTSNFIAAVNPEACTGCGRCRRVCPIDAIELVPASADLKSKKKRAQVKTDLCLGCGVCARNCADNALTMKRRSQRVVTPLNTIHNSMIMAIEKGTLHDFLFDQQALTSHRMMAAVLKVILKLPPIQQVLVQEQFQSRCLEYLIQKSRYA